MKRCRDLGLGPGGFYHPGYRDGAKLHLKMMCLGRNWDPETSEYGDHRSFDGAKPPGVPLEFNYLVEKAIKESHTLIGKITKAANVEDILPSMTPDLCIVNFYSSNGHLGLHKVCNETSYSVSHCIKVLN